MRAVRRVLVVVASGLCLASLAPSSAALAARAPRARPVAAPRAAAARARTTRAARPKAAPDAKAAPKARAATKARSTCAPLLAAEAAAYCKANKLPQKLVKVRLGARKVDRIFVPVTEKSWEDFAERFSAKHGTLILRRSNDIEHPQLVFGRDKLARHFANGFDKADNSLKPTTGVYVTMALDKPMLQHLDGFLTKYKPNGGAQWQQDHPGEQLNGYCMWWLLHAEAGPKLPLAHALGVTRTRSPQNFEQKIVHAGNNRVGVIGVAVADVAAFEKMTQADLMGKAPTCGAADAVK